MPLPRDLPSRERCRPLLPLLASLALVAGCGGAGLPPVALPTGAGAAAEVPTETSPPGIGRAPWELPPELVPSQSLYRLRIAGDEGRGRLRLTLRLAAPDHFQLAAADALGRSLWLLHAEGGGALILDHRAETACRYGGSAAGAEIDLANLELGSFPLDRLPALILGRLPAEPAPGEKAEPAEESGELRDARGRRWTYRRDAAGEVIRWSLREPGAASPRMHFEREVEGARGASWVTLTDHGAEGGPLELTWRRSLLEPLAPGTRLPGPKIPPGYRSEPCP